MTTSTSLHLLVLFSVAASCLCADIIATTSTQIRDALGTAQPGDRILIAPGVYPAGFFQENLRGVTITSQIPETPAILQGGINAINLNDAVDVIISNIICEGQFGNGLNIADGDSFETPSRNITIHSVTVRDMVGTGNLDGIKLSGVTGFVIRNVRVTNWGSGGSAIDPTGSHNGIVENSFFQQDRGGFGSAIRPKGGSKNIIIRANRLELGSTETAMHAGGTTGTQFFRFIDGDTGYEARDITFEGNVVVGCRAGIVFEDIDGGIFHRNYIFRPKQFMVRYLPGGNPFSTVTTQNGRVEDNFLIYRDTASEYSTDLNIGPDVLANTLRFRRNTWVNLANPADSAPDLPTVDEGAIFGVLPTFNQNRAILYRLPWGVWCINATLKRRSCRLPIGLVVDRAFPRRPSSFNPLLANPFIGNWRFRRIARRSVGLKPMRQAYFRLAAS